MTAEKIILSPMIWYYKSNINNLLKKVLPMSVYKTYIFFITIVFDIWISFVKFFYSDKVVLLKPKKVKRIKVKDYKKPVERNTYTNRYYVNVTEEICDNVTKDINNVPDNFDITLNYVAPGLINIGKHEIEHYFQFEPVLYWFRINKKGIISNSMKIVTDRLNDIILNKNYNKSIKFFDTNYRIIDNIVRAIYLLTGNTFQTPENIILNKFHDRYVLYGEAYDPLEIDFKTRTSKIATFKKDYLQIINTIKIPHLKFYDNICYGIETTITGKHIIYTIDKNNVITYRNIINIRNSYLHDIIVTDNYLVINLTSYIYNIPILILSSILEGIADNKKNNNIFCIIDRKTFEIVNYYEIDRDNSFGFHNICGIEENNRLKIILSSTEGVYPYNDFLMKNLKNEDYRSGKMKIKIYDFDLKNNSIETTLIDNLTLDFPHTKTDQINPRYIYGVTSVDGYRYTGLIKFDLKTYDYIIYSKRDIYMNDPQVISHGSEESDVYVVSIGLDMTGNDSNARVYVFNNNLELITECTTGIFMPLPLHSSVL